MVIYTYDAAAYFHCDETENVKNRDIRFINFLPNDKILGWSKLKVFADDKIRLAKMMIFAVDRVENIVGKGESAGYQHFLLFLQCFQKAFLSWGR